jgi:hypothetical protein
MSSDVILSNRVRSGFSADMSGLDEVASFEATPQPVGASGDLFVRFPEALLEGYYLVETFFEDRPLQVWLQITDVATYVWVSRGRTLLWANDLAPKAPLAGASVRPAGADFATTTGPDGVALFETLADLIRLPPGPFDYTTDNYTKDTLIYLEQIA